MSVFHVRVDEPFIASRDVQAVLSPAWWSMELCEGKKAYEASVARFSRPQRALAALRGYDLEVQTGGHWQYFLNAAGTAWRDAREALGLLDLRRFAAIFDEAVERMGGAPSFDWRERQRVVDRLGLVFDDLDDRYYTLLRREGLDRAMIRYIRRHPEHFVFDGLIERPDLP